MNGMVSKSRAGSKVKRERLTVGDVLGHWVDG